MGRNFVFINYMDMRINMKTTEEKMKIWEEEMLHKRYMWTVDPSKVDWKGITDFIKPLIHQERLDAVKEFMVETRVKEEDEPSDDERGFSFINDYGVGWSEALDTKMDKELANLKKMEEEK
jgi:hypothetical protein